ncbi:SDR family NAD(P)-dependent oxidoreductase, partial [Myxococcota bacterium]|nr:SDR family NAD(P)-dependent oxidoreductase [Myxococcota bacterium]
MPDHRGWGLGGWIRRSVSLLPERVVDNAEIVQLLAEGSSDVAEDVRAQYLARAATIESKTGIQSRRFFAPDVEPLQVLADLARALMVDQDWAELDAIFVGTCSVTGFPGLSQQLVALLREETTRSSTGGPLGNPFTLDVHSNACTSTISALTIADNMIRAQGYRNVLILSIELGSRSVPLHVRSFNTSVLFGDAAGGWLVSARPGGAQILSTRASSFIRPDTIGLITGHGSPTTEPLGQTHSFFVSGPEVAQAAVEIFTAEIRRTREAGFEPDWILPHQANLGMILRPALRAAGVPEERLITTLPFTGNTLASSLPLTWDMAARDGRFKPGDKILMVAFGASFAVGSALIIWDGERHELLGAPQEDAGRARWDLALTEESWPLLDQHRLHGRALLPASAQMALLLSATRRTQGDDTALLGLSFARPVEAGALRVELAEGLARLYSGGELAASARIGEAPAAAPIDLDALRARLGEALPADSLWSRFRALGLTHGPHFQTPLTLWRGDGEALAALAPLDSDGEPLALEVMVALGGALTDDDSLSLPFTATSVARRAPLIARPLWVYAKLTRRVEDLTQLDVVAGDERGVVLCQMSGLCARRLAQTTPAAPPAPPAADLQGLRARLIERVAARLGVDPDQLDPRERFQEQGLDSVQAVQLLEEVGLGIGAVLDPTVFYEHPSLDRLAAHLTAAWPDGAARWLAQAPSAAAPPVEPTPPAAPAAVTPVVVTDAAPDDIAIIGMAGRFPQALDLDAFWANLLSGRDCTEEVPADRWDVEAFYDPDPSAPNKTSCRRGGFVPDVHHFDPLFFRLSPREAAFLDPQQRIFLEMAWRAFEDAGHLGPELAGSKIGVYVGVSSNDYLQAMVKDRTDIPSFTGTGNNFSIIANRVSYFLDLTGPSLAIDTACSSGLVGMHLAAQALRAGEIKMALVGGINLSLAPIKYIFFSKAGMLAPDGRCKTFDARADGYVPGEGVGAVLLRPLRDALADGDRILGLLRGTGVNQDGATNGITAPNPAAQRALFTEVYTRAGVNPETISYAEAHGTGTPLGDPIEVSALTATYSAWTQRRQFCGLGSVKPSVGHLEPAAGMAGLFKLLLAMRHKVLPPTALFQTLNPKIQLAQSPFYLVDRAQPWVGPRPLRATASAFSFGGVNAHILVEEAPPPRPRAAAAGPFLLTLSASRPAAFTELALQTQARLTADPSLDLGDVCYTLAVGRRPMDLRRATVVGSVAEAVATLGRWAVEGGVKVSRGGGPLERAEAPSGATEAALQTVAKAWEAGANLDLRPLFAGLERRRVSLPGHPLDRRHIPRPEGGRWGEQAAPRLTVDHPYLDRAEPSAFGRLVFRKRWVLEREPIVADHELSGLAIVPSLCFYEMARAGLAVGAPELPPLGAIRDVGISRPLIPGPGQPVDSTLTLSLGADGLTMSVRSGGAEAREVEHLRAELSLSPPAPRPAEDLAALLVGLTERSQAELDEVHAQLGPSLCTLRRSAFRADLSVSEIVLPPTPIPGADRLGLHPSLAFAPILVLMRDRMLSPTGRRIYLPFHVEEIEVHGPLNSDAPCWVVQRYGEAGPDLLRCDSAIVNARGEALLVFKGYTFRAADALLEGGGLLHTLSWAPGPTPTAPSLSGRWLVLGEAGDALVEALAAKIVAGGGEVSRATPGPALSGDTSRGFTFDPASAGDHVGLLQAVGGPLRGVIHALVPRAEDDLDRGVFSAFALARAAERLGRRESSRWLFLTRDGQAAAPGPIVAAAGALGGMVRTIRQELPYSQASLLDLSSGDGSVEAVLAELGAQDVVVALRGGRRLLPERRPARAPAVKAHPGAVVWIVGGLGGVGRLLALHLARSQRARLVLTGRAALPPRARWEALAAQDGGLSRTLRDLLAMEAAGGEVLALQADVGERWELDEVVRQTKARFGALNGVIFAAGQLRDGAIARKSPEDLRAVLSTKVRGALNVEAAVRGIPLHFFALTASVAGVLGNVGQADYAAANAWLDAFALSRGAPFVSMDWGLWREGGMGLELLDALESRGLPPLETAEATRAFGEALALGAPQVIVARFTKPGARPAAPPPPKTPAAVTTPVAPAAPRVTAPAPQSAPAPAPSAPVEDLTSFTERGLARVIAGKVGVAVESI